MPKRAASEKKGKAEKKTKEDKGPKRALSAYMFFAQDQRKAIAAVFDLLDMHFFYWLSLFS